MKNILDLKKVKKRNLIRNKNKNYEENEESLEKYQKNIKNYDSNTNVNADEITNQQWTEILIGQINKYDESINSMNRQLFRN